MSLEQLRCHTLFRQDLEFTRKTEGRKKRTPFFPNISTWAVWTEYSTSGDKKKKEKKPIS